MDQTTQAYEEIICKFTGWARSRPDIRTAIVIGSRTSQDHPADEWSDLDVIFFTSEPDTYLHDANWLASINEVWLTFLEGAGGGGPIGELWWAKSGYDGYLKELLHRMLERHARALGGEHTDTWLCGRFQEEWAGPRTIQVPGNAFAHYNKEDVWRALFVTMDLFHWLSEETAAALSYPYPDVGAKNASELTRILFKDREAG